MEKKQTVNDYLTENLPIMERLGRTFIKTPRSIFNRMQSDDFIDRQVARLHLLLFGICYHTEGFCTINKKIVTCRRGEFVGKQSTLARLMDVSASTLNRLLKIMEDLKLITVQRIIGGSRIYLNGYDEFTFVPAETETEPKKGKKPDAPEKSAATQMAEAEKRMGGRRWN